MGPEPQLIKINTSAPSTAQITAVVNLKLVAENDPILHSPTQPFDFSKPPIPPVTLATSMFEFMFKSRGVGLTASQVGIPYSVITVGSDDNNKQVFFNPKIIEESDDKETMMEGCLSYPELFLKVERPKSITVEYQHVNGETRKNTYTGVTARIIQHEVDHTLGRVMLDLVGGTSLRMAKDKRAKLRKKIARRS